MSDEVISIAARQKVLDRTLKRQRTEPATVTGDVKVLFRGKQELWRVDKGEVLFVIKGVEDNGSVKV